MSATDAVTAWGVKGAVTLACNCDWGCPCNFNARPTYGHPTRLDGLNFTLACDWPGAIHEGNGEGLILIDERADEAQKIAATKVFRVQGGPDFDHSGQYAAVAPFEYSGPPAR